MQSVHVALLPPHTPHASTFTAPPQVPLQSAPTKQLPSQSTRSLLGNRQELAGPATTAFAS